MGALLCCSNLYNNENELVSPKQSHLLNPLPVNEEKHHQLVQNLKSPELLEVYKNAKVDFLEKYDLVKKLGQGAFAEVWEARCKVTGGTFAVKKTSRVSLSKDELQCVLREPLTLRKINHPNIVSFQDFYKSPYSYFMVCEKLQGDALMSLLWNKDENIETDVRRQMKQLLTAVGYFHAQNIVHRDLKVANLMLTSNSRDSTLKVVDFGFSQKVPLKGLTKVLGTPGYMAPEVIKGGPYGKPVDMWACGVIMYTLLCGYPPFQHDLVRDIRKIFRIVCSGCFSFQSPRWDNISFNAKDLIRRMFILDQNKRATAEQILQHPWFFENLDGPIKPSRNLIRNIELFNEFVREKKAKSIGKRDSSHQLEYCELHKLYKKNEKEDSRNANSFKKKGFHLNINIQNQAILDNKFKASITVIPTRVQSRAISAL